MFSGIQFYFMRNSDGHQDVIRMSYMTSWSSGDDVHTEAGRRWFIH